MSNRILPASVSRGAHGFFHIKVEGMCESTTRGVNINKQEIDSINIVS